MNNQASSRTTEDIVPRTNDVLLGKGTIVSKWAGNHKYKEHVKRNTKRYNDAISRAERSSIVIEIADTVQSWGGRFLEQFACNGPWHIIDSCKVRRKIGQALRYQMELLGDHKHQRQWENHTSSNYKGNSSMVTSPSAGPPARPEPELIEPAPHRPPQKLGDKPSLLPPAELPLRIVVGRPKRSLPQYNSTLEQQKQQQQQVDTVATQDVTSILETGENKDKDTSDSCNSSASIDVSLSALEWASDAGNDERHHHHHHPPLLSDQDILMGIGIWGTWGPSASQKTTAVVLQDDTTGGMGKCGDHSAVLREDSRTCCEEQQQQKKHHKQGQQNFKKQKLLPLNRQENHDHQFGCSRVCDETQFTMTRLQPLKELQRHDLPVCLEQRSRLFPKRVSSPQDQDKDFLSDKFEQWANLFASEPDLS